MKLQWCRSSLIFLLLSCLIITSIDQLDKADAASIPESYIYLLAAQCIISLREGFASFSRPIYSHLAIRCPRAAGDAVVRAPPTLRNLDRSRLSSETWEQCIWKAIFLLLDALTPEIRNLTDSMQEHEQSVEHAWDQSKIPTLTSIGSVFRISWLPRS